MKCGKCNRAIEDESKFCNHCGNYVMATCPDCGEAEWVGRRVCRKAALETMEKIAEIRKGKNKYFRNFLLSYIVYMVIMLLLSRVIINPNTSTAIFSRSIQLGFVIFLLCSILSTIFLLPFTGNYVLKKTKKKEEDFLRDNPEDARILELFNEDVKDNTERLKK